VRSLPLPRAALLDLELTSLTAARRDLALYQDTVSSFALPTLNDRFEMLRQLGNVFIVQPDILRSYLTEAYLARIENRLLRPFVMMRSDYGDYSRRFWDDVFGPDAPAPGAGAGDAAGPSAGERVGGAVSALGARIPGLSALGQKGAFVMGGGGPGGAGGPSGSAVGGPGFIAHSFGAGAARSVPPPPPPAAAAPTQGAPPPLPPRSDGPPHPDPHHPPIPPPRPSSAASTRSNSSVQQQGQGSVTGGAKTRLWGTLMRDFEGLGLRDDGGAGSAGEGSAGKRRSGAFGA